MQSANKSQKQYKLPESFKKVLRELPKEDAIRVIRKARMMLKEQQAAKLKTMP